MKGWSVVGIKRYNEIMRTVAGFRADQRYTAVEEEVQKRWKKVGKDVKGEMVILVDGENENEEEVEEALTEFDL